MGPRTTDWGLALTLAVAFGSGLWSFTAGRPGEWWIVALHGMSGLSLGLLLAPKLRRVWPRLRPRDRRGWLGLIATILVLLVLGTGVLWSLGVAGALLGYNLLNWHVLLGFALVLIVSLHMVARARPLRRAELAGRRQALRAAAILLGGALLWPLQALLLKGLRLPGARRRFTGSRALADEGGFPTVSWVADRPRPLEPSTWSLLVGGLVARPYELDVAALLDSPDTLEATLDCTGGFYTTQRWTGRRVGRLLDQAGVDPAASWVRFVSVTGYRWSLPIEQAREALIATQVGGAPLGHGHGAPARLVAPGERGFVWVKWLAAIEAHRRPDPGQLLAINSSWLSPVGRGDDDV